MFTMPDQIEYSRVYRVPAPLLFRPRVYGPSRARVQERAGTSETNTLSGRPLLFHSSFRTNDFHSRVAKIRNSRLSKFFFISNFTELVRRRYYCSVSVGERMVLIVASIVPFQRRGIRNDARPRDTIKERERESLRVVGLLTFPGARFWHRDPTFFVRPTDISLHSHAWNESRATRSPSPPRNAPPLCKARDPRAVDHVALRDSTYPHIFIVAVHHRDNDFFNNVFSFRNENGLRPRIWIANNFFTKRKQFPPGWKKFRGEREIYSGAG